MRFYTITAVSNFLKRRFLSTYHWDMFHGIAERDGKEPPHHRTPWANTESPSTLSISRTIRHLPAISEPATHLVVSERLAQKLRSFRNVRVMRVMFKRLVDVDWQKGDKSWEKGGGEDPSNVLRTMPDMVEFHRQIGEYFEVQTHRWKDIVDQYPSAREITIEEGTPPVEETDVIRLSPEMLIDYPMLWWGGTIVNEEVFDILDASIDRDFFIVRKYEVP